MGTKDTQQQILEQLQNLTIVLLAQSGASQKDIRSIVGVDIHRVNRVAKYVKVPRGSK